MISVGRIVVDLVQDHSLQGPVLIQEQDQQPATTLQPEDDRQEVIAIVITGPVVAAVVVVAAAVVALQMMGPIEEEAEVVPDPFVDVGVGVKMKLIF